MPKLRRAAHLIIALLLATPGLTYLSACGDDDTSADGGDATVQPEAGLDSGDGGQEGGPDGRIECREDADCDDGVECTRDVCNDSGQCTHRADFAVCDDGVFCNGVEECDALDGCIPGPPRTCSDDDVCTIDRCDEETKTCEHNPRDFDEDGEADWHCEGGTDCDDRNPGRGSMVAEICDDMVDNDCDSEIDEAECGRPAHDLCDDALDVSAGGIFEINTLGATPDYSLSCTSSSRRDVVLTFTLEESRDVRIEADGRITTYLGLRRTCGDRDSEFDCAGGFPGTIRARALEPGTYFVIVLDYGGDLVVDVEFTPPSDPPLNDMCEGAIDVSAGGTFSGSFVDVADDTRPSCGLSNVGDLYYTFTLTEPRDVVLNHNARSTDTVTLAVRSTCDGTDEMGGSTELRCVRNRPAQTRLRSVPAGTYYIVAEGTSRREVDFDLTVAFEAPTAIPPGETCGTAIPVTIGTPVTGTLTGAEDDLRLSCSFGTYGEMVYSFTLTERRDVTVEVSGGRSMYVSVRPTCDTTEGRLRCTSGSPALTTVRDLAPGTYYVIVESFRGGSFTLNIETRVPTVPTPVSGNENCTTAHVIPITGGLFTGDTTTMISDLETGRCGGGAASPDAVFRLDLATAKRVTASTSGSAFDTVLHVHSPMCMSGAELYCDDDGGDGSTSRISRDLAAGTYFFVVDGFASSSRGAYSLEVVITDPSS